MYFVFLDALDPDEVKHNFVTPLDLPSMGRGLIKLGHKLATLLKCWVHQNTKQEISF
jgi:hypothetical protein